MREERDRWVDRGEKSVRGRIFGAKVCASTSPRRAGHAPSCRMNRRAPPGAIGGGTARANSSESGAGAIASRGREGERQGQEPPLSRTLGARARQRVRSLRRGRRMIKVDCNANQPARGPGTGRTLTRKTRGRSSRFLWVLVSLPWRGSLKRQAGRGSRVRAGGGGGRSRERNEIGVRRAWSSGRGGGRIKCGASLSEWRAARFVCARAAPFFFLAALGTPCADTRRNNRRRDDDPASIYPSLLHTTQARARGA